MSNPMSKQRSNYTHEGSVPLPLIDQDADLFVRNVSDGRLRVMLAEEPMGWHLSISFVDHKGRPSRYPRWDEILHARELLLDQSIEFVMFLPKADEYVALHDTTFHLHEHPARG